MCQSMDHRLRHCVDFKELRYAERLKLVTREKLCHVCLNEHGGKCKFKIRCNIGDCREFHISLMHPVGNTVKMSAPIRTNCTVLFRIVPVQLHCGGKTVSVLAFLDEGSSVTLVEKKLADRLGAVGIQERLTIWWTGNTSREEDSRRISLWASGTGAAAGGEMLLHTVHTVDKLMLPHQKLDSEELAAQYEHMRGLPIESYDGQPQLLIGVNNIHAFAPMEAKVGTPMEPIAVRTKFGWTVYGPRQTTSATACNYLGCHRQIKEDLPPESLRRNYALEESVVFIPRGTAEKKARTSERTTQLGDVRYAIGLLSMDREQEDTFRHPDRSGRTTTNMAVLVHRSTEPRRDEIGDTGAFESWHLADGEGESPGLGPGSDLGSKWGPAFSTRHSGEFLPHLYEEKRPTRRLVTSAAKPEKTKIDRRKEKRRAMRALDEGRKLSGKILPITLAKAAGNSWTISSRSKGALIRGRREISEVVRQRGGDQGLRWVSPTNLWTADGKMQARHCETCGVREVR
nr:uncharacterized protein LOC115264719 [Aedes albopictus]